MKNSIKMAVTVITACIAMEASAQAPMTPIDKGGKKPSQNYDTVDVPREVRVVYYNEYPTMSDYYWYGYPSYQNDYSWYDYDNNSYISKDKNPEYYVSEFKVANEPHKVVYSKKGEKVVTHRTVKNQTFPVAVMKSFMSSKYKTWKETDGKVEIIKEADKSKVYKITVTKGMEKRALYYDAAGKLLNDKKLKM